MKSYFISYTFTKAGYGSSEKIFEFRTRTSGPVEALNEFHRWIQLTVQINGTRGVIRPKLQPHEYRIVRLFNRYFSEGATNDCNESDFDLPKSENPLCEKNTTKENKETEKLINSGELFD